MPQYSNLDNIPLGFKLIRTLTGHQQPIHRVIWSPDGARLASGSEDRSIRVWDVKTGKVLHTLHSHNGAIYGLAWSPDGRLLASSSDDRTIRVWDAHTGQQLQLLRGHTGQVYCVAWSPNGRLLASGARDGIIQIWDTMTWQQRHTIPGHTGPVYAVAWARDSQLLASGSGDHSIRLWDGLTGRQQQELKVHFGAVYSVAWSRDGLLASGSADRTIRFWDPKKGTTTRVLEGHTDVICSVAFSFDGLLVASQGHDGTIQLWNRTTCDLIESLDAEIDEASPIWLVEPLKNLAFHPSHHTVATLCANDRGINIWDLNLNDIPGAAKTAKIVHYTNAKVVLVGDTGVGKSALALALRNLPFEATSSTHGRHVWSVSSFDNYQREIGDHMVACETLLWDLAGQPGYRVFHQLHLNEVAVALVVFDARSEVEPFAGLAYWARALDTATRGFPLVKLLVSARVDRGGIPASQERINEILSRYGFKAYFATSAARGEGIAELLNATHTAIAWEQMPIVSVPELFHDMQRFVVEVKASPDEENWILRPRDDLLKLYQQSRRAAEALTEAFDTCLGRLETAGLIRRLTFRNLVLLQPEILDHYCAWLALAARNEPDGLGSISEQDALDGRFSMDPDRALARHREVERYILLATVQEVVERSIAWREATGRGIKLVFPSELRADMPQYPGGYVREVGFQFEGPVSAIYATLAVRLINSLEFKKQSLFKDAALFLGPHDRVCGFAMDYPDLRNDALGRLVVFFEPGTEKDVKLPLLRYVNQQLEKMALQDSVRRERVYQCICGYTIPTDAVELRKQRGARTAVCPVCVTEMPIDDLAEETAWPDKRVADIETRADAEQQRQKRLLVLRERARNKEFDVFLCHNRKDRRAGLQLAQRLLDQGILPWIDRQDELVARPATASPDLARCAGSIRVVAIVLGEHALGNPQEQEYRVSLQHFLQAHTRPHPAIVPVLLPEVPAQPSRLHPQLRNLNGVDFRLPGGMENQEQMKRLIQAILNRAS